MASSLVSSFADGVATAATCTIGAVAGAVGNAIAGASGHVLNYALTAAKGVVGVTGGAVAVYAAAWILIAFTLKAVGFTTGGPAAGSFAASWMSSTAVVNGGAVPATSLYSTVQATAMGGGVLHGAPAAIAAGAVAVTGAVLYKTWF